MIYYEGPSMYNICTPSYLDSHTLRRIVGRILSSIRWPSTPIHSKSHQHDILFGDPGPKGHHRKVDLRRCRAGKATWEWVRAVLIGVGGMVSRDVWEMYVWWIVGSSVMVLRRHGGYSSGAVWSFFRVERDLEQWTLGRRTWARNIISFVMTEG